MFAEEILKGLYLGALWTIEVKVLRGSWGLLLSYFVARWRSILYFGIFASYRRALLFVVWHWLFCVLFDCCWFSRFPRVFNLLVGIGWGCRRAWVQSQIFY